MNVIELRDILSTMIDIGLGEHPVLLEIDTWSGQTYHATAICPENDVYIQKYNYFGEDAECCVIHGGEIL